MTAGAEHTVGFEGEHRHVHPFNPLVLVRLESELNVSKLEPPGPERPGPQRRVCISMKWCGVGTLICA